MANTCVDCKEVKMSNQTFEDKLDNLIFEAVESAASYSHKVSAEEADYIQSSLKQAILAWHNKQILESLDRLLVEVKQAYDKEGDFLEIAAEHAEQRNVLTKLEAEL